MGVNRAIDITSEEHRTVLELLTRHLPGTTAWIYGSRVKWTSRPQSDLDLVVFATSDQAGRVSALREAFEESNLPFRVDLFVWDAVPESFRHEIESEHVVVTQREKQYATDGWSATKLGDVVELKRGYDLPKYKRTSGPIPVVSSSGSTDYHMESKVQGPGVVTGRYGTLGRVFFIQKDFWPLNTTLYVRNFKGNDPRFIAYLLQGLDFSAYSDKAAVPGLNRNHLHEEIVRIPTDIDEQRATAHILGSLDDKIELNRQMNETLEAMARALFKSWFVDFDPVRAKLEGRDAGLPKHLSDLFPDQFVESELGEIPDGWQVRSFAETIQIIGGGTPKTSIPEYWNGDIPWFSVVDAPTHSDVWVIDTSKKCSQSGIENSSARILPVGTTIISARGTVGRVALAGVPMAMNQSCYGLQPNTPTSGVFNYFTTRTLVPTLKQHTHGSVFNTITRDTLTAIRVILPCQEVIDAYERLAQPALEQIRSHLAKSRTLTTLRDTLLPKLISGELRVNAVGHKPLETT